MSIKTTINLKTSQYAKISAIATQFDVSKSFIINTLARKAMKYDTHKNRFVQRVQYQERLSGDGDSWHCTSVSFLPDVYEKCLDLRKFSKLSVSFFIVNAFEKYLIQIIKELQQGCEGDNYSANYLMFYTQFGYFCQMTIVWDMMEQEKLQKIYKLHRSK